MPIKKKIRNYSIIIVSDATSANKEFVISSKLIRNSIIGCSLLFFFFGFILFHYLTITLDKQKIKRLEHEVDVKDKKIYELTSTISSLSVNLKEMKEFKDKILVATGIAEGTMQTWGTGGGPDTINTTPSVNLKSGEMPQLPNAGQGQATLPNPTKATLDTQELVKNALSDKKILKSAFDIVDQRRLRLAATPCVKPLRLYGVLTQAFGPRVHPFTGKPDFHRAIDISSREGNEVIATADGTVLQAQFADYYGNLLIIDHGFGYLTKYAHLSAFKVKEGQRVKRFQVIGLVGNTGRSTSAHLHYEVWENGNPINPISLFLD